MIQNQDTDPKTSRLGTGMVVALGAAAVQRMVGSTALPRWRLRLAFAASCGACLLCVGLAIGEANGEPPAAASRTDSGAAKQNPRNDAREEEAKPIKSEPALRIPSLEPYVLPSKAKQALVELAGTCDVLILGEIHGTQEVPAIAVALLEPLAKQGYRALALEIPSDQQEALSDWATGKTETIPSFFTDPFADGRGNIQVLSLIRIAVSPPFGWRLICFDESWDELTKATSAEDATAAWKQRDKKMAANLIAERSRLAADSKVLAICGNFHARTSNPILAQKSSDKQLENVFGRLWPSFAARLCSDLAERQVRSINVVPHGGGHFGMTLSDDGKTSVGVQAIRSIRTIEEAEAQPLDKQFWDWDWELNLPRATPVTFLTPRKNPVDAEP